MDRHDITAPIYHALEITEPYLKATHDAASKAQKRATEHMVKLFNEGERRPLALANLAIAEIERLKQPQAAAPSEMYDGTA
jgi:hypothetical protein